MMGSGLASNSVAALQSSPLQTLVQLCTQVRGTLQLGPECSKELGTTGGHAWGEEGHAAGTARAPLTGAFLPSRNPSEASWPSAAARCSRLQPRGRSATSAPPWRMHHPTCGIQASIQHSSPDGLLAKYTLS